MGGKKMIIIAISLIAVGLLAYFIFFNGKSEEDDSLQSSYNGSKSSKSSRKNKKTNSNNAQFSNGVSAQSDIVNSQQSDSQSQSFQSENSKSQSQGYFGSRAILQQNQIDGNGGVNSIDYSGGDSSSGGGGSGGSSGGASSGGGSSSSGGGTSTYPARLQSCIAALQPVLNAKSTDTTTITNALLNVMGFSMLTIEKQNNYVASVAFQTKGTSAANYCKTLLQDTNPQTINVASLYTNCTTMVKDLYNTKGSGATESDVINAFSSLGIMNGATTSAQQKTVLQNYLGGEYTSVIAAMRNLNSANLKEQSNIICAKTSSGIVNAVNGSSTYLSCVTTANSAKTNNITNVATALTSYKNLSVANQILMTSYYNDFLSGKRTVEFICEFLAKNAIFTRSSEETALSDMILSSSSDINDTCDKIVNSIKSEYNNSVSKSNVDNVANIVRTIDEYDFLIPGTMQANIVNSLITQKITNADFKRLSTDNKPLIAKRLYASDRAMPSIINGFYKELLPQICKCSHTSFGDMEWKDVFVSYIILKQGSGTKIPMDVIQKQALITTSDFYRKCYADTNRAIIDAKDNEFKWKLVIDRILPELKINSAILKVINLEEETDKLICIAKKKQCIKPGECNNCNGETVESICTTVTLAYLQAKPEATNINTLFTCPPTESGKSYDSNICYNLTETQRIDMAQNLYDTILAFKNTASGVRREIIKNLWKIHSDKQIRDNTSVFSSQCVEQAGIVWYNFLTTQPQTS